MERERKGEGERERERDAFEEKVRGVYGMEVDPRGGNSTSS